MGCLEETVNREKWNTGKEGCSVRNIHLFGLFFFLTKSVHACVLCVTSVLHLCYKKDESENSLEWALR